MDLVTRQKDTHPHTGARLDDVVSVAEFGPQYIARMLAGEGQAENPNPLPPVGPEFCDYLKAHGFKRNSGSVLDYSAAKRLVCSHYPGGWVPDAHDYDQYIQAIVEFLRI